MYQVLLVDDEHFVIRGINSCVDWESLGFDLPLEAYSGAQALAIMKEKHVDVVITDIKMAPMDGLQLMKQIKETGNPCEIIILSCYNDFAYSRAAIQNGAFDYLFKPEMMPEDIQNALRGVRQKLDLRKQEKADLQNTSDTLTQAESAWITSVLDGYKKNMRENKDCGTSWIFDRLRAQPVLSRNGLIELCSNLVSIQLHDAPLYSGAIESIYSQRGNIFEGLHQLQSIEEFEEYANEVIQLIQAGPRFRVEIQKAQQYIRRNLGDSSLSLKKAANFAGMSKSYFSRQFKEQTGIGFAEYLNRTRIEKARELYCSTDLRIYQIAEQVGFSDWRYMTKLYKKLYRQNMTDLKRKD